MEWPLQTVKAIADAAPLSEIDLDERILIHISYSPRRYFELYFILSTQACNTSV